MSEATHITVTVLSSDLVDVMIGSSSFLLLAAEARELASKLNDVLPELQQEMTT